MIHFHDYALAALSAGKKFLRKMFFHRPNEERLILNYN